MQAFQYKVINAVAPESYSDKVKAYFHTWRQPEEIGITPQIIANYDQKKNNFCTGFGSAGCCTYNTGIKFTNEYIAEWCLKYIDPEGLASMITIAQKFASEHGCQSKILNVGSLEAGVLFDNSYGMVVSITAPSGFWNEGTKNGKAVGFFTGDPTTHTVFLIRVKGRDYLINSWGGVIELGLWNQIHVELEDLIRNKYIRPLGVVIFKK